MSEARTSAFVGESRTRAGHSLHECTDADTFAIAFRRCWGEPAERVAARAVAKGSAEAILLVGSLPFGIGSAGSDLDFAVLVDADSLAAAPRLADDTRLIYFGRYPGARGEVELANLVIKRGEVEVDILFIDSKALATLVRQIDAGGTALTREHIQLIGRLRSGWLLHGTPAGTQAVETLRAESSFDLLCTTRFLRNALKDLEHARLAAGQGEPALAGYLGRACVEKTAQGIFAAQGLIGLSTKWLRLVEAPRRGAMGAWTPARVAETVRLLFPPAPTPDRSMAPYLDDVGRFYAAVLDDLTRSDMALRLTMNLCPQIYDPSTGEAAT